MKKIFSVLLLLVATGCGVNEMSSKMDESNQLMKQNINVMSNASSAIKENTGEVKRSTSTMQAFGAGMQQLHPFIVPALFVLIIALLFMPVIILMKLSKKLMKYMDRR